jgi:adenylate kinase
MVLNLIFLGPPGSGKGTVSQSVSIERKLTQISTGDLIRAEVASGSEFGKKLGAIIKEGHLVDDATISEILEKKMASVISTMGSDFHGFILDGYPRTIGQADLLEKLLAKLGQKLSAVIYIESSVENVVSRISTRWGCPKCGRSYNTVTFPSKVLGICDADGATLTQREDDKEATVRSRYATFMEKTMPLVKYYQNKGLLKSYDGNVGPAESIASAEKIIDSLN